MDTPLVHCSSCAREWRSPTLAEGLREVGRCPRCGGDLVWAAASDTGPRANPAADADVAPHLVLGVPRR